MDLSKFAIGCLFLSVLSSAALAEQLCLLCCCDCEPRIKFLDDLFSGLRDPTYRDPHEERIETERHDSTQSTKTVGRGVTQLEAGYNYFYKD